MKFLRLPLILLAVLMSTPLAPKDATPPETRIYDTHQTSQLPEITSQNWKQQLSKYIKNNWRFAIKRVARDIIHNKIMDSYGEINPVQDTFFDGASHTAVALMLDNMIPSDDEDWMLSIFLAGALKYYASKDITRALAASTLQYTQNYMMESFVAKKIGKYAPLLNAVPFFSESLGDDEPSLAFNFRKGLTNRIEYFMCWNEDTRISSPYPQGSAADAAAMNFVSCALIPSAMESLSQNKMFTKTS